MSETLMLGAVAYDPKVVTIWEGFRAWFAKHELDFDFVLYSNYERQVRAHFEGSFDLAWNSPLAWIQTERIARARGRGARAIGMRNTDRDLSSVIVANTDSGIETLEALRGKIVAVGALDSPQATLIPLNHLAREGLEPRRDFEVREFDVLVGKHGDHVGGERDAAKALAAGEADAACMIDFNHLMFGKEGTFAPGSTRILARTQAYDHCVFTVLDDAPAELLDRFTTLLLGMSWDDAEVRPLLQMEGLKEWKPGRTTGFDQLNEACDRLGAIDEFVKSLS